MAEIINTSINVDINTSGAAAELRNLQQKINAFNLTLNKGQATQAAAAKSWAEELSRSVNRTGMFRSEVVKMQSAAAALDSTLKKGQSTLGQFFSAAFNRRSAMAAEVFALAAERARTMQTQFIATGKAAKGMQDALAIRPLTAFSSELSISSQRMQILSSMFRQGTTQLINFGKNVQWAGRQLMVGFTVPLTIFGTTAGRVFRELEKEVVSFKKVYGDLFTTPAELNENLNAVKGLAAEFTKYGVAVKDTMNLAAQAAAAGRRNADLTDAVTQATRLATLGQLEQNAALEATIALQSAFKISGKELGDTINFLNMVENQTVVSLQDIAAAIPRVAPVIEGLGGSVKDLTVFLAAFQEGGVSAEQGANALKSGLASLINPTKNAKEVLGQMGVNLQAIVDVNRGDLMGTVTGLAEALQTLDQFSRQQALEEIFGKFQYARLGALFENIVRDGSQASQVMDTLGYSSEQLAQTANKELSTIAQSFGVQLTGAIERFKLAIAPIGELFVKMAIPLVNFATKIANWFNSLPEGTKNLVALATVITGVIVPAGTMMLGLFMNLVGTLAKMTQGFGIFTTTLLTKGPFAAIKSLTQSSKYLSLAEIDAANAAQQLGTATGIANEALLAQVISAGEANVAINALATSYQLLIDKQLVASQMQGLYFGAGKQASDIAGGSPGAGGRNPFARGVSRIKAVGLNTGGQVFTLADGNMVPGVGNTDTVPAMLTPGEFVVNKQATQQNLDLLHAINGTPGTKVVNGVQYAIKGREIDDIPFEFSDRRRPEESRKAYKQYMWILDYFDNDKNKIKSFETNLVGFMEKQKPGTRISSKRIQAVLTKTLKEFGEDPLNIPNIIQRMQNNIPQIAENAHVSGIQSFFAQDILTSSGMLIPKDIPFELLNNRTLKISERINKNMARGGWPISDVVKDGKIIQEGLLTYLKKNKEHAVFRLLDEQFEQFLKEPSLGYTDDAKNILRKQYAEGKEDIFNSYIKDLEANEGKVITDHGKRNTIRMSDLTENAFAKLRSKSNELSLFDDILSIPTDLRLAQVDDLEAYAQKIGLKTKSTDKFNLLKEILEYRGYDLKNNTQLLNFLKTFETIPNQTLGLSTIGQLDFAGAGPQLGSLRGRFAGLLSRIKWSSLSKVMGPIFALNKGGRVPGVQYAMSGKLISDAMRRGKFGEIINETFPTALGSWKAQMEGITTKREFAFDNFPIKYFKPDEHLFPNVEIYDPVSKKVIGKYNISEHRALDKRSLLATLETERSKGAKHAYIRGIGDDVTLEEAVVRSGLGFNKGGMIPGIQKLNTGGIGKAIFERAKVGAPRVKNLSGLDSRSMNMIDELAPFIGADAAVDYAKILQKGYMTVDIGDFFKKAKGIEDIVQQRYSTWKSQNQWAVYSPGYQDVRDRALNKIRKQVTDEEFKRMSTGKESLVDSYNRYIDDFMNRPRMNKGGKVPGIQYLGLGGIGKRLLNTPSRRSRQVLRSLFKDADSIAKSKGNKGIFDDVSKSEQNFLETSLASAKHAVGQAYAAQAMPVYESLVLRGIIKPGQFNSFDDFMNFLNKKSVGNRSTMGQKNDPIISAFNEEFMRINHGLGPNDTLRFYRNARPGRGSDPRSGYYSLDREMAWGYGLAGDIKVGGGKRYQIDLKPGDIPGPIMSGGYADEFAINIGDDLAIKAKEIGDMLPNISKKLTGQQGMTRFFNDKKFYSNNDLSTVKFNSGNIVPGVGDTDTVPAMLTPGEFVINKKATQENLDLLHAINSGKLSGYNKGGGVAEFGRRFYGEKQLPGSNIKAGGGPRTTTAIGAATPSEAPRIGKMGRFGAAGIGMMASIPFMSPEMMDTMGPTGSMIASMVSFIAAQKLAEKAFQRMAVSGGKISAIAPKITTAMQGVTKSFTSILTTIGPRAIPIVGWVIALGDLASVLIKLADNTKQSTARLNDAMYGSAESLENMAKGVGKLTASQQLAQKSAELIAGQRTSQEAIQMSSQFMQSAEGQKLTKDIQFVGSRGEDQATALRNQLSRGVVAGLFTAEEARQIALDVGKALKKEKVGLDVVAQLTDLLGPNGERIEGQKVEIMANITAPTDFKSLQEQVDKEFERIGKAAINPFSKAFNWSDFSKRIFNNFLDTNPLFKQSLEYQMRQNALQRNTVNNLQLEKETRSGILLDLKNGVITQEQYIRQINKLNQNNVGGQSVAQTLKETNARNLGNLEFNAAAGGFGTGIMAPFRALGAQLTGSGAIRNNLALFGQRDQIAAAEDFANKLTASMNKEFEAIGLDEEQRRDLLDFISNEFGFNLQQQAIFFGQILTGEISSAAVVLAEQLKGQIPNFNLEFVSRELTPFVNNQGLLNAATQTLTGQTSESARARAADLGLRGRSAAMASERFAREERGQRVGQSDQAFRSELATNLLRIESLSPEIVKSLKIDVQSPIDVQNFGPETAGLIESWEMMTALDPALDKSAVFSFIATDSSGKARNPDDVLNDLKVINQASADLEKGGQVAAKAELQLAATFGGLDINDPAAQKNLDDLKSKFKDWDKFKGGTKKGLIQLDAQMDANAILIDAKRAQMNALKDGDPAKAALGREIEVLLGEQAKLQGQMKSIAAAGTATTGDGEESAFQKIMKSAQETKKYSSVVKALLKDGIAPENIALVDQASLLEMSTSQRKQAIKAMQEQQNIQKAMQVGLTSLEDQRIRTLQNELKEMDYRKSLIQRQIDDVEKLNRAEQNRISNLQRQNEIDQRQTDIRNRALDEIGKKEKVINDAYDQRSKALDAVATANNRYIQQQQNQIALASALTSGDFGAAAAAATQMTGDFAANQLEDTRAAMDAQRERELSALTAEVNGQLLTREQITLQIEQINERVYQRSLQIQQLEDIIYTRESTQIKPLRDQLLDLEDQRIIKARELEDAEYNKWKTELDGVNALIKAYNELAAAKAGKGGKTVNVPPKGKQINQNKYFGGMIFKGSSEPPPSLRMYTGSIVPGIGNSDTVPAMLTPGEFVVRKSAAKANMGLLKAINGDVFPTMDVSKTPSVSPIDTTTVASNISAPVYNYSVNVNVPNTSASPNEIADVVINKIKMVQGRQIRGNKF